jgi:hypothetical protein
MVTQRNLLASQSTWHVVGEGEGELNGKQWHGVGIQYDLHFSGLLPRVRWYVATGAWWRGEFVASTAPACLSSISWGLLSRREMGNNGTYASDLLKPTTVCSESRCLLRLRFRPV